LKIATGWRTFEAEGWTPNDPLQRAGLSLTDVSPSKDCASGMVLGERSTTRNE
jgi:hypothetical protein